MTLGQLLKVQQKSAPKGPGERPLPRRVIRKFEKLEMRRTWDVNYWLDRVFGKVKERRANGDIIRPWNCPALFAESIAKQAAFDKKGLFRHALTTNVTKKVIADMRERLHEGNGNFTINGPQGISKSTLAHWIFLLDRAIKLEYGKVDPKAVEKPLLKGSYPEILDAYANAPPGSFILGDEISDASGTGVNLKKKAEGNVVKAVRVEQTSSAICCPEKQVIPGCDFALTPIGKWQEGVDKFRASGYTDPSECKCKVLVSMRDRTKDDGNVTYKPLGIMIVNVAEAILFMKASGYEDWKRNNLMQLRQNHGEVSALTSADHQRVAEIVERVIAAAREQGWDGEARKKIARIAFKASIDLPATIKEEIISDVWDRRREFQKSAQQSDAGEESEDDPVPTKDGIFTVSPDDELKILEQVLSGKGSNGAVLERNVELYKRRWFDGERAADLAGETGIDLSNVTRALQQVDGIIADRVGKLYEKYLVPILEKEYDRVEHDGASGQPDLTCWKGDTVDYISVKCLAFRGKGSISIRTKTEGTANYWPEIRAAQKDLAASTQASVVLIVRDRHEPKAYYYRLSKKEILQPRERILVMAAHENNTYA